MAYLLFAILLATLFLLAWGYWRYDVISFLALIVCVFTGLVPADQAFSGFSNPAVIVVASVMVLSNIISNSNLIGYVIKLFNIVSKNITVQIFLLCTAGAILAALINNIGALAVLMPVAVQTSHQYKRSPALVLMPLAFATILGGLMTAIGSPTNLIVSHYREMTTGSPYHMFDFTTMGSIVTLAGLVFLALAGWRVIYPGKNTAAKDSLEFDISDYTTEVTVAKDSSLIGTQIKDLPKMINADFTIIGLHRGKSTHFRSFRYEQLQPEDKLIIEAAATDLKIILDQGSFSLASEKPLTTSDLSSSESQVIEAVIQPTSTLIGKSAQSAKLRNKYAINLLGLSRKGHAIQQKLNQIRFRAGDVVLIQGDKDTLRDIIVDSGFLPLAERNINLHQNKNDLIITLTFLAAMLCSAMQLFSLPIIFSSAVLILALFKVTEPGSIYQAIDWSILLSIAAMLPIGDAMQSTGAANIVTLQIEHFTQGLSPYVLLTIILTVTVILSNIVNNAAAAVIMAPIAIHLSTSMGINLDTLLMGVVVGATCSFLTPIANQNNLLVMGPGGYGFKDYLLMGLPLQILVIIVSIPVISWLWPF